MFVFASQQHLKSRFASEENSQSLQELVDVELENSKPFGKTKSRSFQDLGSANEEPASHLWLGARFSGSPAVRFGFQVFGV